ncbi:MAG: prepilin peptidase [Candidatus Izimaplasma sp.]|nr:prepilin peptidase [Candidatus Izimaplasma bacterium]
MNYIVIALVGYVFFLGTLFGSFFNVVGIRIPKGESLLGRSHCPNCNKVLGVIELIPVLGYIFVGGKCKSCHQPISIKYPVIEFITGVLFAFSFVLLRETMIEYIVIVLFISLMMIVTVSDLYYRTVPDKILLIFFPVIFVLRIVSPINYWYDGIIGGILGFGFLYLIAWYGKKRFKKEALGGGDIKLYAIIGLVLGYQTVFLSLFFAALSGLIVNLIFGKKEGYIPFVPFIFFGALVAYFYGDIVLNWYMGLLI